MSALTCGVDIGSTNVKVILVDERARAVWTKAVPTPRVPDKSGVATDVLRLVAMIEEMIIEGWRMHGRSLPIQAIAVVGVGEDGVGVRADLDATRRCASMVRRAGREAGERSPTEFPLFRAGGDSH